MPNQPTISKISWIHFWAEPGYGHNKRTMVLVINFLINVFISNPLNINNNNSSL